MFRDVDVLELTESLRSASGARVDRWGGGRRSRPTVSTWPRGHGPALYLRACGRRRYAPVVSRLDHADGRTEYQVNLNLTFNGSTISAVYEWPQHDLTVAHPPTAPASTGPGPALPPQTPDAGSSTLRRPVTAAPVRERGPDHIGSGVTTRRR